MTIHRSRLHRSARGSREHHEGGAPRTHQGLRRLGGRLLSRLAADRGDVPGWVLITLMTAGIVVALWAVASEQIIQIFNNAMAPFLGGSL